MVVGYGLIIMWIITAKKLKDQRLHLVYQLRIVPKIFKFCFKLTLTLYSKYNKIF